MWYWKPIENTLKILEKKRKERKYTNTAIFFHAKLQKACKLKLNDFKWSERYPLEKKRGGEHPVGHRHGCTQPHTKEQSSARLGQSHNIGHCVDEAWPHKHPEVQESRGEIRPSEWIQKTDHHKGNNVFQVILMASMIQEQRHQKETTSVEPSSLTQWYCHKTVLQVYRRTLSTSGSDLTSFFLSSVVFAKVVSSMFAKT